MGGGAGLSAASDSHTNGSRDGFQNLIVVPSIRTLPKSYWTAAQYVLQRAPWAVGRLVFFPEMERFDGLGRMLYTAWTRN